MKPFRIVAALLAALILLFSRAYAEDIDNWFAVPADSSAIALLLQAPLGSVSLSVTDGAGEKLDAVDWSHAGLPLLRQYRVPEGEYRLEFDGIPSSVLLQAKAREISFLELIPDEFGGFDVTIKSANFQPRKSILGEFVGTISAKLGYAEIEPRYFAPAKNALYFHVAGPGVKPPPE